MATVLLPYFHRPSLDDQETYNLSSNDKKCDENGDAEFQSPPLPQDCLHSETIHVNRTFVSATNEERTWRCVCVCVCVCLSVCVCVCVCVCVLYFSESMLYLDGKRHFSEWNKRTNNRDKCKCVTPVNSAVQDSTPYTSLLFYCVAVLQRILCWPALILTDLTLDPFMITIQAILMKSISIMNMSKTNYALTLGLVLPPPPKKKKKKEKPVHFGSKYIYSVWIGTRWSNHINLFKVYPCAVDRVISN